MQWPCGTSVPGAVPEPGCCCFGGTPYWFTLSTLLLRLSAGVAEFSDEVLVSVQTTSCFDVRVPARAGRSASVASSAAFELMKYSVPPLLGVERAGSRRLGRPDGEARLVDPASLGR